MNKRLKATEQQKWIQKENQSKSRRNNRNFSHVRAMMFQDYAKNTKAYITLSYVECYNM